LKRGGANKYGRGKKKRKNGVSLQEKNLKGNARRGGSATKQNDPTAGKRNGEEDSKSDLERNTRIKMGRIEKIRILLPKKGGVTLNTCSTQNTPIFIGTEEDGVVSEGIEKQAHQKEYKL